MQLPNTFRGGPDERGHFGIYGGRFVAETLMPLILELERAYEAAKGDPAFQQHLSNEFPSLLPTMEQIADPVARRTFLKLMGASLALAGVSACTRQPAERIVPYVRQPEELVPGRPLFYGSYMYLHNRLAGDFGATVVPGVSSPVAGAAAIARPLVCGTEVFSVLSGVQFVF